LEKMNRSRINNLIKGAEKFIKARGFLLPPFASWTPQDWKKKGHEADEIRRNMLGWDLTDFGSNNFAKVGLVLFTIRNGNLKDKKDTRNYAEKILLVDEGQVTPWHFHYQKTEDIINRGGGVLIIQLAWPGRDEKSLDKKQPVEVSMDGVKRQVAPLGKVELTPGESITLPHHLYHTFCGKRGKGRILVGEVSNVNDDTIDNCFLHPTVRFWKIKEDEPAYRLLSNEYPKPLSKK
jgi:D-lyxose ketol-isomerase